VFNRSDLFQANWFVRRQPIMRATCVSTVAVMVVLATSRAIAQDGGAVVFWLNRDPASEAPRPAHLEATVDLFPGSSLPQRFYIWARLQPSQANMPIGDLVSLGLNLRSTSIGTTDVLDLTRVELDNPLLDSSAGLNTYRHQFVVDSSEDSSTPCVADRMGTIECAIVEPCIDSITGDCGGVIPPLTIPPDDLLAGFGALSIDLPFEGRRGVGIGEEARLYSDPTFDGENWRIGWFEFVPRAPGTAEMFLQVGRPGMWLRGAAEPLRVYFGSASELPVVGNEHFAESAEADARLTIRLMPDYNRNGAVDAADYVVWRNTQGSVSDLQADGNASGVVDAQDYEVWKQFFGRTDTVAEAAASLAGSPEPPTVLLAVASLFSLFLNRRRE
jgi:hypothetical protein